MKIYISGKISGEDRQLVREKFACAVQRVRDMGHEPVSPLDNGLGWEDQWRDHMAVDCYCNVMVFTCFLIGI